MNKIMFLMVALAAGMAAVSCSKSDLRPVPAPGGENQTPVSVSLALARPEASVTAFGESAAETKASVPLDEGTADARAHDLWALQYDADGNLVGNPCYLSADGITTPSTPGGGIDYKYDGLSLLLTSSAGASHTVYLVANTNNGILFGGEIDVTTETKLNAAVQAIADGSELGFTEAGGILMLGVYTGPVASGTPMTVILKRLAAKVTLKLKSSLSGFTVTGVQLKNVAAGMYYCGEPASGADFPASGDGSHVDYPAEDLTADGTDGAYKTFTWYVPENLRKNTGAVSAAGDRTLDKTDGKATYIEVSGMQREGDRCRKVILQVLLGDLGAGGTDYADFNVKRNTSHTVLVDIRGLNEGDNRISVESYDMSNCAMLMPGAYTGTLGDSVTFDIRKCLNNGFTTADDLKALMAAGNLRAEVLWMDNRDWDYMAVIDLDKANGLLTITAGDYHSQGNAVVALYDNATAGGNILWSWHIWVTDYRPDEAGVAARAANTAYPVTGGQVHTYGTEFQRVNGTSRVIMDRNLGATKTYYAAPAANDATADQAFGLFYQWGRKDPFPRADGATINANDNTYNASVIPIYGPNGAPLDAPSGNLSATGFRRADIADVIGGKANTFVLAVKNPLLFIYNPDLNRSCDWYAEVKENQNPTLWGDGGVKSPYDPCPKGWRVPPFGTWNDFIYTNGLPFSFPYYADGSLLEGGTAAYITSGRFYNNMAWYPATGSYDRVTGTLYTIGITGNSWSTTSSDFAPPQYGINSKHMRFTAAHEDVNAGNNGRRGHGQSVRCIQYVE